MRILAIDPGFERLGIAVIERDRKTHKEKLIHSECFKTKSSLPFPERLALLGARVKEVISQFEPEALAIETLFFTTNQKTAMRVAEARGVIIYEAIRSGLSIAEFTPLEIKVAITSYGKADKTQMMRMVRKLIVLAHKTVSDDELDAIAIGLTYFARGGGK
ncbi:MAG: crossover junction endodeoxyribonuclease RuvC [Patescibacteria group bacterium]